MAHETWREIARRVILKALDDARDQDLDAAATLKLVDSRYPFGPRANHPYAMWLSERKRLVTNPTPKGRPVFGGAIKDDRTY
jgi:hypothetical protein